MKYTNSTDVSSDFHKICITRTASTILYLLGVSPLPKADAPIEEVLCKAAERFSPLPGQAPCDRIFLYNPDAVAMWIYEKYAGYFTEKPARSCVAVKTLPKNVLCEVEVIAVL